MEEHRDKVNHDSCNADKEETSVMDTSREVTDPGHAEMPFYAWECISICLKSGITINLIIKDELDMKIFLMFLIQKLKSFNGTRDTFD